jgi:dienelactone hydrolase
MRHATTIGKTVFFSLLALLLILAAPVSAEKKKAAAQQKDAPAEDKDKITRALKSDTPDSREVTFPGENGLIHSGTYYPGKGEKVSAVILLHMYQGSQKQWQSGAKHLQAKGFSVLTYDLRGFGKSKKTKAGETLNWKSFTEEDYQLMIKDLGHAVEFLSTRPRVKKNWIGLVGADLGANIALSYAVDDERIKSVVLVSANRNYQGIKIWDTILAYGKRPVMFCVTKKDVAPAHTSNKLHQKALGKKELKLYKQGSGHGTEILNANVGLIEDITAWLKETL